MNLNAKTILAGFVAVVMLAGSSAMAEKRGGGKSFSGGGGGGGGGGYRMSSGSAFSGKRTGMSGGLSGNGSGNRGQSSVLSKSSGFSGSSTLRNKVSQSISNNGIGAQNGQRIGGQMSRTPSLSGKPLNGLLAGGSSGLSKTPLKNPASKSPFSLGGSLPGRTTIPGWKPIPINPGGGKPGGTNPGGGNPGGTNPGGGNPGGGNPGNWLPPHSGHQHHGHWNWGYPHWGHFHGGCYGHWNHWHNHINHWFHCPVGVVPCALPVVSYSTGVATTVVTEPVIQVLPQTVAAGEVDLAVREVQILRAATAVAGPVYRVLVTNNGPSAMPVAARVILFGVTDAAPDQHTPQAIGTFPAIAAGDTTVVEIAMPATANACPYLLVAVEVPEGVRDINENNNLAQGEVAQLPRTVVAP